MKRDHWKQMLPIITHFAEGGEVQVNDGTEEKPDWVKINDRPTFQEAPSTYRKKPTPRPLAATCEGGNCMNEITDKEVERFRSTFDAYIGSWCESYKAALADFLANRPAPVATLRPIAEMPETVQEGCVRLFGNGVNNLGEVRCDEDTLFLDLTAPDPEADLRREFEEAMTKHRQWERSSFAMENGEYVSSSSRVYFEIWKLAKGAKP